MVLEFIIDTKILNLLRFLMECARQLRLGLRTALFWIITQQVVVISYRWVVVETSVINYH